MKILTPKKPLPRKGGADVRSLGKDGKKGRKGRKGRKGDPKGGAPKGGAPKGDPKGGNGGGKGGKADVNLANDVPRPRGADAYDEAKWQAYFNVTLADGFRRGLCNQYVINNCKCDHPKDSNGISTCYMYKYGGHPHPSSITPQMKAACEERLRKKQAYQAAKGGKYGKGGKGDKGGKGGKYGKDGKGGKYGKDGKPKGGKPSWGQRQVDAPQPDAQAQGQGQGKDSNASDAQMKAWLDGKGGSGGKPPGKQ